MEFHGVVEEGEFGQMSSTQLAEWVMGKIDRSSGRNYNPASVRQCCNYVIDHPGAGGGGATPYTYNGKPVYHISYGQRGSGRGCTLFFADSGNNTGVIVAIGYHESDPGGQPRYEIDWTKRNWHYGRYLTF